MRITDTGSHQLYMTKLEADSAAREHGGTPYQKSAAQVDTSFSTNPVVTCGKCNKKWRALPLDLYFADDGAAAMIADALRDGRDEEAILIYLETNWTKIKSLYEREYAE